MKLIRFYRFSPTSQPPFQLKKIYPWFKEELQNSSIEPVDTYEISNNDDLIGGSEENRSLAKKILHGLKLVKAACAYLKQRLS